jgi:hypothetical protein
MTSRKSNLFFTFLALMAVMTVLMFFHAHLRHQADTGTLQEKRALLRGLPLTDLCLFTEASYTRHWSQADRHTAFQDSPMALEHFPSGSIYLPPSYWKRFYE